MTDVATGARLAFAYVEDVDTKDFAFTDEDGECYLWLPFGPRKVLVWTEGYQPFVHALTIETRDPVVGTPIFPVARN